MSLMKGILAKRLIDFANKIKDIEQTDIDAIIKSEAENEEDAIYEAIRSLTITIPSGSIIVVTPQGSGSNIQPIILNNVIT